MSTIQAPEELEDFDEWLLALRDDDYVSETQSTTFVEEVFNNELKERVETKLEESFNRVRLSYKLDQIEGFRTLLSKDSYPKLIQAIRSMVGDDEVFTTNSLAYSVLCILIGPCVARIKISWDDVQWNRNLFNYAEGWVLLPPSRDSSFESVNRNNRGNGVPFVLDSVKFKDLSCVRKQSAMNVDLASKFKNLSQRASWTNRFWPTWTSHQFALVLGIEIFDFMRSKIFPFLFSWEGGCGGAPPFNNLHTAAGCLFRFRGGRAKRGLLGIMSDSNRLQRGEIRPEEAFFTKNLNLAMAGDKNWLAIRSQLERDKHENILEGRDYYPDIVETVDNTVPQELIEKSATIYPEDAFTGVAMSYLREKGYILTELDLVEKVEAENRLKAIWGPVPMLEVEDQIQRRKEEYRESFHQVLTEISERRLLEPIMAAYRNLEDPMEPESIMIMKEYYITRIEQALRFNSFIYNERIRVFKHEDVEAYFQRGAAGIKTEFAQSIGSRYKPEHRRQAEMPWDSQSYDDIEKWLRSGPLHQLIRGPMPTGIGPDDSRIVRDFLVGFENNKTTDGVLLLIISSDRALIAATQRVLSHAFPEKEIRVLGLTLRDYLKFSLSDPPKAGSYVVPGRRRVPQWIQRVKIWNPVRRILEPMHQSLQGLLSLETKWFWKCREPQFILEYDYPNINRGLLRFTLERQGIISEYTGGFLSRSYVTSDRSFMTRELDEVVNLSEFDYTRKRSMYPVDALRGTTVTLVPGKGLESTHQSFLR